jgi:hypothetical protein
MRQGEIIVFQQRRSAPHLIKSSILEQMFPLLLTNGILKEDTHTQIAVFQQTHTRMKKRADDRAPSNKICGYHGV